MRSLLNGLKVILLLSALLSTTVIAAPANILILGDSLSAGYGIEVSDSWPSLLQQKLDHRNFSIVNASVSGETTQGGRLRLTKLLMQYKPAIVIVELGANDGLRGYSTIEMKNNLSDILLQIKQAHAKTLLIGMKLPPNYGEPYITQFRNVFPGLAIKHHVSLLPFLLDGVTQFQADNLHPAASAQPRIMTNVLQALKPLLR